MTRTREEAGPVPASSKETALWLLERLVPGAGVNNLHLAFRVTGGVDPALLTRTLDVLVARHEVLRRAFRAEESGLVRETVPELVVPLERETCPPEAAAARLADFVAAPFPLDGSPMLRALVLGVGADDVVCVVVHHLVFDTVSAAVLLDDFVAVYDGLAAGAPPQRASGWAQAVAEPEARPESLAYWREQLRGVRPDRLALALVPPGPSASADPDEAAVLGDQVEVELSGEAVGAVATAARALRVPEAVVLLAAYAVLLHAHGAGPDLVIGSPLNVRGSDAPRAIGYHVNVAPLRIAVDPEAGFAALVRAARDAFFGALAHHDVPVDDLLGEIPRSGGSWRHTVFRHVFNYVPHTGPAEFTVGGRPAAAEPVATRYSKFDLEFFLLPRPDGIRVRAVHNTGVVSNADAHAMVLRYDRLLVDLAGDAARAVGSVPVAHAGDLEVLTAANSTAREVPFPTVPAVLGAVVAAQPDRVAVVSADRAVTFGSLWTMAGSVRDRLRAAGVGRGDVVALLAARGPELAAAVFGVWLAGAAYLPLDPEHPVQRLAYQLADSGAAAVLVGASARVPDEIGCPVLELADAVAGPGPDEPPAVPVTGADPAYLIYTSGSTGRPKGTLVGHAALANLIGHFAADLGAAADTALWSTTFSFDISALELFAPLVRGGRVVVAPDEAKLDGRVLAESVRDHDITLLQATPTTWRQVLGEAGHALAGRTVLCGGEPLPAPLAAELVATGCSLHNVYGPTETTIWSTCARIGAAGERIGVGAPIANTTAFVADEQGRELPVGVIGELCIAGAGVALGYHGRPELTAERFRTRPGRGRHYRTGDRARWLPDGTLEVLGRADRQVKLRGNRIELGEVESVLLGLAEVSAVAVTVLGEDEGAVLVAAVLGTEQPGLRERLWSSARAELPAAAVPQDFVFLERFPLTGNGKVDHPELRRMLSERAAPAAGPAGAQAAVDPATAGIIARFAELLDRADVVAGTNFFTHGGHSLLAAKLAQQVQRETGVRVRMADVFNHPTPAELAGFVESGG
ncbi:amino acid adenylation domain-containing protein [Saccharopolyspora indica]|uniref:non-ribosomal peptide synthetase n=1 Tax=Saccharopolyspora indica TaxID=1229659 RepID=UPI0022EA7CA2|nr:amino acid adenylation domain-containing protein [Saccharopolyspora indica]MDA3647982.1 amino acid adenylation domain-containing protein [Saccharopolyspora indica]